MSNIDTAVEAGDAEVWHVKMPSGDVYTVSVEQLDEAFQGGHIDENTLVMQDGMSGWATLGEVLGGDDDESADSADSTENSGVTESSHAYVGDTTDDVMSGWSESSASDVVAEQRRLDALEGDALANTEMPEAFGYEEPPASAEMPILAAAPSQGERAAAHTLLNYPPPPPVGHGTLLNYPPAAASQGQGFSSVAPLVQDALAAGLATPAPTAPAAAAPEPLPAPRSYPVPPPVEKPVARRYPVPPPVDVAPYPAPQGAARGYPSAPPLTQSHAPAARSYPVPPPLQPQPAYAGPARNYPMPPPQGLPQGRVASYPPPIAGSAYPPPVASGVYPPPVISSAAGPASSGPGFVGPKSTPPVAYEVDDFDVSTPRFRSRGRGVFLAAAAAVALVGGAVGLSRMDGSSLMLFPSSSTPVAAANVAPVWTPPKAAPKPVVTAEPVAPQPTTTEAAKPAPTPSSDLQLAEQMKQALRGAKVPPAKKPATRATSKVNLRRSGKAKSSSSTGPIGKGGNAHDPLNGAL
jgi:hypothetical protein